MNAKQFEQNQPHEIDNQTEKEKPKNSVSKFESTSDNSGQIKKSEIQNKLKPQEDSGMTYTNQE